MCIFEVMQYGVVSYRQQCGTGIITYRVSPKAVIIQTAAHNLMYFTKSSGESVEKYADEVYFYYHRIGDTYKLKFKVLKQKVCARYLVTQTIKDGSDICLAIGMVDENDPNYSEAAMNSLNILPMKMLSLQENEIINGFIVGYPLELYCG